VSRRGQAKVAPQTSPAGMRLRDAKVLLMASDSLASS
jgi:hypothetical protein